MLSPRRVSFLFVAVALTFSAPVSVAAMPDAASSAPAFRKNNEPVAAQPNGLIVCEAEEFRVESPGWQAKNWGENYFCATFANCFLSRKGFLGAPEKGPATSASIQVQVPEAGRYLALARYEAPYRFSRQFHLKIEQNGKTKLNRLYGARDNVKIWPRFAEEVLQKEVAWYWGAVENMVWEGHDAYVDLVPGVAKLTLIAEEQPEPAAKRNVDLVMLTRDEDQVKKRIETEGYLPLDGMLTQSGDVFARLHNQPDGAAMSLVVPHCIEHSPYWVHLRDWPTPKAAASSAGSSADDPLAAAPGQSTGWVEVGGLMDSLNDGAWTWTAKLAKPGENLHYKVEFGVKGADGQILSIRTFESRKPKLELAFDADTRYSHRIREWPEVLYELVDYLKQHKLPGKLPLRTLIYCYTFDPRPDDPKYTAARHEFIQLFGISEIDLSAPVKNSLPAGYIDVRDHKTTKAEFDKWKAEGVADKIAVVSLGDEIGLAAPPVNINTGPDFRTWLQSQKLQPNDVDPNAGGEWTKILYKPTPETSKSNPSLYYYSQRYAHAFGIAKQKEITDPLRAHLPNAMIGANYSPHHGAFFLNEVHMWINMFRHGGMTMPWAEDYAWQIPIGSQQMNFLGLDQFRAGIKDQPKAKIQYYVMPHTPGNTPDNWRRQFYGDLGHGMQIINLFEFRPVQAAYTENYVNAPEMYLAVRRGFMELGGFDDIVQDGRVRRGVAALWFSEAGDIWGDNRTPFAAGKRTLYVAIRHQQLPLDVLIEEDALAGDLKNYKVLYLADQHVSRVASKSIADWVAAGGHLCATAGAGMLDESNQPNTVLGDLLGVKQQSLLTPPDANVQFEKQDLPFAKPLETVTWNQGDKTYKLPVFAAVSRVSLAGAELHGTFADGSPAVTLKKTGAGSALYCGLLPGLTYFQSAIPLKPVDRGATADAMSNFIPTAFDAGADALVAAQAEGVARPIACSEPLVDATIVAAPQGVVIPLVNWSAGPVKGLKVTVTGDLPKGKPTLAGGGTVTATDTAGKREFVVDLDVADAIIVR